MRLYVDRQVVSGYTMCTLFVQFADWAAPIVPILKPDKKSLRICGHFKMTVNQASKLDAYPIPKVEDLFAKLSRGKRFSKPSSFWNTSL